MTKSNSASSVVTTPGSKPAAVAALEELGWVEAVVAAGDTVILTYNNPDGLGLWALGPDGELSALAPGTRPDAGTIAIRESSVACCLRDASGLSRPAVVDIDSGELVLLAVPASIRPRALAWLDGGSIVTVDDPDRQPCNLVSVPADGGDGLRTLASLPQGGRWTDPRPSVNADGRLLYTVHDGTKARIDLLDTASGACETVLEGNPSAAPQQAAWSPSGDRALCSVRRATGTQAVLLDLGAQSMQVLQLPGAAGMGVWKPDGTALATVLDGWPVTSVAVLDLATGEVRRSPLPSMMSAFGPAWQGGTVLFVASGPATAASAWRWDPRSDEVAQVSPTFALPPHPEPRAVRVPTANGFDLPGLLHEPERPRPDGAAALFLHGGPSACWRAGWDPVATTFVTAGFRVLHGDTRGSIFRAWDVPRLGPGEFGHADVDDALELIRYLSPNGEPVVVYAHSYGTFVAYRVSLRDSRVRALVLTSGFLDPADLDASKDTEVHAFRRFAFGAESTEPLAWLPASCPILMVHGEEDTQVPLAQAHGALARLEGDGHRLLVLDGEGHGFTRREAILRWIPEALAFAEQALEGGRT